MNSTINETIRQVIEKLITPKSMIDTLLQSGIPFSPTLPVTTYERWMEAFHVQFPAPPEEELNSDSCSRQVRRKLEREAKEAAKALVESQVKAKEIIVGQSRRIDEFHLSDEQKKTLKDILTNTVITQMREGKPGAVVGLPCALFNLLHEIDQELSDYVAQKEMLNKMKGKMFIPSNCHGFVQHDAKIVTVGELADGTRAQVCYINGIMETPVPKVCPKCGQRLITNGYRNLSLHHAPVGNVPIVMDITRERWKCSDRNCTYTLTQEIPFKAEGHFITKDLELFLYDLLAYGFNLKECAEITGVGKNIVKDIDKERLANKYTLDGKKLKLPEEHAEYLAIDEFKLHNNRIYATMIIDLKDGKALWLARGKSKDTVRKFVEHVGQEWMSHVKAVACDMNADFSSAFLKLCPHIRIVFDHFHIVKNFNDKVISAIRKDEYNRLIVAKMFKEAEKLKRSKYILTASRKTLRRRDREAAEGKKWGRSSKLFGVEPKPKKGGNEAKLDAILEENKLLFECEVIKEYLDRAYQTTGDIIIDRLQMGKKLHAIIRHAEATKNEHMIWFAKLIKTHYSGIISYATYPIASGKIEGTNQKIKTVRREGYGYPDDEYFFLKIMDFTRKEYVRNPKSHVLKNVVLDALKAQYPEKVV